MLTPLLHPRIQEFIKAHEQDDVHALLLKGGEIQNVPMREIAAQIECRKKAKQKLPYLYNCKQIIYPVKLSMEQCSSELTAQYKATLVKGKTLADLTGGAGVDTYFFSQHFEQVDYIEMNPALADISAHNFKQLQANNITAHKTTAEAFISSAGNYDVIYLDPARRDLNQRKVFRFADCTPDMTTLGDTLLQKAATVVVKASPLMDIQQGISELNQVSKIDIISVNNECKEVLFTIDKNNTAEDIAIHTANYTNNAGWQSFTFSLKEEADAQPDFSAPLNYLYEPNASIMKAGAFKSIAQRFHLKKLHPHSHLYTSNDLLSDFPGRQFKVIAQLKYSKKDIKAAVSGGKANITARNFPDTVEAIRKKTGLKSGGEQYLFATTLSDGKKVVLLTSKV